MADYRLEFTDINIPIVTIGEKEEISDLVDITLFGFTRLQYGRDLNENFVHLLENFAAPENPAVPGTPLYNFIISIEDDEDTGDSLLSAGRPLEGQVWYNKTVSENASRPYVYYDNEWHPLEVLGREIAANWGQIADGEVIPQPQSESGYTFTYDECSWIVSPFNQLEELEEMECRTDNSALVTMQYRYAGDGSRTSGVANYLIVGLRDNNNLGVTLTPEPIPSPTPTPSPSASPNSSPPPTPTITPTPTVTPSGSPSEEVSPLVVSIQNDQFGGLCRVSSGGCTANGGALLGFNFFVSGGVSPYTYDWVYESGQGFDITNPTTANPTFSRFRIVEQLNVTGYGKVTVTDSEGTTAEATFAFITDHERLQIDETPSASPTPSPVDPTPEQSPLPEPTPTPSPYDPLVATRNNDSSTGLDCVQGASTATVSPIIGTISISGGSGNYSVSNDGCSGTLCGESTWGFDGGSTISVTYTGPDTKNCPVLFASATYTFTITDADYPENSITQSVTISHEFPE